MKYYVLYNKKHNVGQVCSTHNYINFNSNIISLEEAKEKGIPLYTNSRIPFFLRLKFNVKKTKIEIPSNNPEDYCAVKTQRPIDKNVIFSNGQTYYNVMSIKTYLSYFSVGLVNEKPLSLDEVPENSTLVNMGEIHKSVIKKYNIRDTYLSDEEEKYLKKYRKAKDFVFIEHEDCYEVEKLQNITPGVKYIYPKNNLDKPIIYFNGIKLPKSFKKDFNAKKFYIPITEYKDMYCSVQKFPIGNIIDIWDKDDDIKEDYGLAIMTIEEAIIYASYHKEKTFCLDNLHKNDKWYKEIVSSEVNFIET